MQKGKCKLREAPVHSVTLQQHAATMMVHLPPNTSMDDTIEVYGAVVSECGKLVHSGDYICFSDGGPVSEC